MLRPCRPSRYTSSPGAISAGRSAAWPTSTAAWHPRPSSDLSINTGKSGFLGKLVNSQTTGEGVVLKFRGTGKVLVCSRNKGGFLDWILGNMPAQKTGEN